MHAGWTVGGPCDSLAYLAQVTHTYYVTLQTQKYHNKHHFNTYKQLRPIRMSLLNAHDAYLVRYFVRCIVAVSDAMHPYSSHAHAIAIVEPVAYVQSVLECVLCSASKHG